jgi:hypothetical protein
LYLLALAGLAWALAVRGGREAVLFGFAVPYLLVIVTWSSRFERYAIPLLPSLTLLGAVALSQGVRWLSTRTRLGRWPWPAVVLGTASALLLVPALGRAVAYHRLLAQPDTRVLGSSWVEREVPPGAKIALEPFSLTLPVARRQLREAPESLERLQPLRPVALAPTHRGREDGYWLVRLDTYDLDQLLSDGVEYVALSSFVYQRYRQACDQYPAPCRFYAQLEAQSQLVYVVSPGVEGAALSVGDIYSPLTRIRARHHPGPTIRIYQLPGGRRG